MKSIVHTPQKEEFCSPPLPQYIKTELKNKMVGIFMQFHAIATNHHQFYCGK